MVYGIVLTTLITIHGLRIPFFTYLFFLWNGRDAEAIVVLMFGFLLCFAAGIVQSRHQAFGAKVY